MLDNKKNLDKFIIANRYETEECIGSGSTGVVYKSKDLKNDSIVAVKILKSELTKNIKFINILKEDLKDVFNLEHENIVKYYDLFEHKDKYYIVMDYIEGSTLEEILNTGNKFSIEQSVELIKQCASGLDYAAKNNTFHKSFKPQNIIIDKENKVKITNFGFSKAISTAWLTLTGTSPTQVEYMSPEQAEGEPANQQSDLYTLGVIAYQLLTGDVPFKRDGTSILSVAMKHINKKPDYLIDKNPDIPLWLENIVLKCLEKSFTLRFKTGEDIIKAIDEMAVIQEEPISKNEFKDTLNIIHNDELSEILKDNIKVESQKDTLILHNLKKEDLNNIENSTSKDTEIVFASKKTNELDTKVLNSLTDQNEKKENLESNNEPENKVIENKLMDKSNTKLIKPLILIITILVLLIIGLISYIISMN